MGSTEQIQVGPEIHFAQRLAANEKKTRDRAIKRLRRWLHIRSASENVFTKDDMLKIWKGLFYCMWMQDKPLIQEDLATSISELIHCFNTNESAFLFVECFFLTMSREWYGIDNWRLDKFMMFVRRFVGQCFVYLIKHQLDPDLISSWNEVLERSIVNANLNDIPMGLQYHLSDIYVEELTKNGLGELPPDKAAVLLDPYCKLLVETQDPTLMENVKVRVFHYAMKIADLEDDKEEVEESENYNGSEITDDNSNAGDLEEASESECVSESTTEIGKKKKKKKSKYKHTNYRVLVRRMTKEALHVPYMRFDCKVLGDRLFILGSQKHVKQTNRLIAYDLQKRLKVLSKGIFPFKMRKVRLEKDLGNDDFEKAAANLVKFEEKLRKKNSEMKEQYRLTKKRKHREDYDDDDNDDIDNDEFSGLCLDENEEDEELEMMLDQGSQFKSERKNNQKRNKHLKIKTIKEKTQVRQGKKKRKNKLNVSTDADSVNDSEEISQNKKAVSENSRISEKDASLIVESNLIRSEKKTDKETKKRKKIKKEVNVPSSVKPKKNDANESVLIVHADDSAIEFPVCKFFSSTIDSLKKNEAEQDLEFSLPPPIKKPTKLSAKKAKPLTSNAVVQDSIKVSTEQMSELNEESKKRLNEITDLTVNLTQETIVKDKIIPTTAPKQTVKQTTVVNEKSTPSAALKQTEKEVTHKKQKPRKFANRYFNEKLSKTYLTENKNITEFPVSVKAKKQGFSKHRDFISMEAPKKNLAKQAPLIPQEQLIAFKKVMKTPPAFVRKAVQKVTSSKKKAAVPIFEENMNSLIKKSKRVNFNISSNAAQEIKDYHHTVKLSPGVPFDSEKKPMQGVLKSTPKRGK